MPNSNRSMPLKDRRVSALIEGYTVKGDRALPIKEGDSYLAERNTGPVLLTCRTVANGIVFARGSGYAFDRFECAKVTSVT